MTRYIQRLAKKVGSEHYRIHMRIISVSIAPSSALFTQEPSDKDGLMGVYFKLTRGQNRMVGKKRFAIYSSGENGGNTLIDENFE